MTIRRIIVRDIFNKSDRDEHEFDFQPNLSVFIPEKYREGHVINTARLGRIEVDEIDETLIQDGDEIVIMPEVGADPISIGLLVLAAEVILVSNIISAKRQQDTLSSIKPQFESRRGPGGDGTFEDSPTYGWNGIRTSSNVDVPVPVVFGKTHVGGNVINAFIESDNNSDQNHMNLLIALSEGEIQSIGGITADTDGIRGRYHLWDEPEAVGKIGAFKWPKHKREIPLAATGLTKANGTFFIDIKCSDPTLISSDSQIEISSSGRFDANEWHFPDLTNLTARDESDALVATSITATYQTFELAMSVFVTTGGELDVNVINWIRVFNISSTGNGNDENASLSWRNAQIRIGDDDIASIGDKILIDNNPISNYRGVELSMRMGTSNQTVIPNFERLHRENDLRDQNIKLLKDVPQTRTTDFYDVDAVKVNFEIPALYRMPGDSGNFQIWHIWFKLEYRLHDDETAQPWTVFVEDYIEEMSTNTIRRSYYIEGLTGHRYDIRVTRTSDNPDGLKKEQGTVGDLFWVAIDEIRNAAYTHPFTALLGVRVLATDQLSGTLPDLSIQVEGRKITDWNDDTAFSNNPVRAVYDLLINDRFGTGDHITPAMIDTVSFDAEADYCDVQVAGENRFELDLVLDGRSRALDIIGQMAQSFRASFYYSAGKIRCSIDRDRTATQLFTMGNIVRKSFRESFASLKASRNVYELQFIDQENQYRRDSVQIGDEAAFEDEDPIRSRTVFIPAIVRRTQAQRIASYLLLRDKHNVRTISFKAATDAVACQGGDVIEFAHEVPAFGLKSGRVKSGGNSTVTLHESVTLPFVVGGDPYSITARIAADDSMETKRIRSVPATYPGGTSLDIEGTWTTNPSEYDIFSIGPTGFTGDEFFWLQMNDNAASATVRDSATGGDDKTFSDPGGDPNTDAHSVTGKVALALGFDGADDEIPLGATFAEDFAEADEDFTIAVWVKSPASLGGTRYVMSNSNIEILFITSGGGSTRIRFTPATAESVTVAGTIDGDWHHYVIKRDGTTITFWVDGVKDGPHTDASYNQDYSNSGTQFMLGARFNGAGNSDCVIDDFRIYQRGLTDAEVATIYNSGDGTVEPIGTAGTSTITKPFRVTTINRSSDFEVELTATEHNVEVFDETGLPENVTQYTLLPDPRLIPPHVTNLNVLNSAAYDRTAIVGFLKPDPFVIDAADRSTISQAAQIDQVLISVSIDEINFEFAGATTSNSFELRNLIPGKTYFVRAVAVSKFNVRADKGGIPAPVVTFTYDTEISLSDVKGIELFSQGLDGDFQGQDAHFAWRDNSRTLAVHPAGEEAFGAGMGARDSYFKDFVVQIYVAGVLVRTEHTTANEYTYTYLKNLQDAGGLETSTGARDFQIRIFARDDFNRLAEQFGFLDVTNPAPSSLIPRGPFTIGVFPVAPNFTATVLTDSPGDKLEITWEPSTSVDTIGYLVHQFTDNFLGSVSPINGWSPTVGNQIGDTAGNTLIIDPQDPTNGDLRYYKIAPYDSYGRVIADLNYNAWGVRQFATRAASGEPLIVTLEFVYW